MSTVEKADLIQNVNELGTAFYNEKEQLYLEADASGVKLGGGLL